MLPFLIPLVPAAVGGISSLITTAATAAGVASAGKAIYKKGVKDGYVRCSKQYEEKLRRQADLFLQTTNKWKKERTEYEALLDEYELTISELEAKIAETNSSEYKQRLKSVKNYKSQLSSLAG